VLEDSGWSSGSAQVDFVVEVMRGFDGNFDPITNQGERGKLGEFLLQDYKHPKLR
jgi:hypothetical protein